MERSPEQIEAELRILRLEKRIDDLETIVRSFSDALKESSQMLSRITPKVARRGVPHEKKMAIAATQGWKCADPFGDCVLFRISDGTFAPETLPFHADHIVPFCKSHDSRLENIQVICALCHNRRSRDQRLENLESRQKGEED